MALLSVNILRSGYSYESAIGRNVTRLAESIRNGKSLENTLQTSSEVAMIKAAQDSFKKALEGAVDKGSSSV